MTSTQQPVFSLYPLYKGGIGLLLGIIKACEKVGITLIPHLKERLYTKDTISSDSKISFWFHAASMGEVRGVFPLIKCYVEEFKEKKILITTTSATGLAEAKKLLPEAIVTFAPIDSAKNVRNFIHVYKPDFLFVAETELWPCLIKESSALGLSSYLINARISDKTFSKYYFFKTFISELLECFSIIFAQSNKDVERFEAIGVSKNKIKHAFSTKFDFPIQQSIDFVEWWNMVNQEKSIRAKNVIAYGSVRDSDEKEVILSIRELQKNKGAGEFLHIVVPRHPERFEPFYDELQKNHLRVKKITDSPSSLDEVDVLYIDRMGDLLGIYSIATVCFVGGTFGEVGGHNVLEPAYFSKPILTGKSTHNIEEVSQLLTEEGALCKVSNGSELAGKISTIVMDREVYKYMSDASRSVYHSLRGASEEVFKAIQMSIVLCLFVFQACSPIKGYSGPELPKEEITTLFYQSCDSNILKLRCSVAGLEFQSNGINLMPGSHTVDSYIEYPQPPFNCVTSYYFDQVAYDQCIIQRNQAISRNRKYVPLCTYSDFQKQIQNCQQSFRQFLCSLKVQLDKAKEYNLCVYSSSGFVRAKISDEDTAVLQNEVECSYISEQTRAVQFR